MGRRSIPKQILRVLSNFKEIILRKGRNWERNLGAWSIAMAEEDVTERVKKCKEGLFIF
jgi:hypothetical protein